MSQPPRNRPPSRQGQNRPQSGRRSDEYYDEPPPPPRRRSDGYPQQRSRYNGPPQRGGGPYYQQRPRAVQPQRDPFPYVMGGLIGAMVVGLMLVIFLIVSNNNSITPNPPPSNTSNTQAPAAGTPPRMALDEFKALYDNPATRPVILDVRPAQSYAEGHIAGAISVPEAEVDILLAKIPKDKLVVAYCQ